MSAKKTAQSEINNDFAPERVKNNCNNSEQPREDSTTRSTPPISYNIMKNIMEHLSIEKRIDMVDICPAVRTAERKADLHLDRLLFGNGMLLINDRVFRVSDGKIHIFYRNTETMVDNTETSREVLMKKLLHRHLGGRNTVRVRRLLFVGEENEVANLPEGVQFECETLCVYGMAKFSALRPFLKDVPLKQFSIDLKLQEHIPRDEMVLNAEYIEISKYSVKAHSIEDDLIALKSRHIHIEQMDSENLNVFDVVGLALDWMKKDLPVGTRFTTTLASCWYICHLHHLLILLRIGARKEEIYLEGLREPIDCVRIPMTSGPKVEGNIELENTGDPCVTIPMTSGHELKVFAVLHRDKLRKINFLLVMQVMENDSPRADQ